MTKSNYSGASKQLSDAINKLEAYALDINDNINDPVASVSRTISMMRSLFISNFLSNPERKKREYSPPSQTAVLHAVETINRHRFFIEKLWGGSPAEKELAESYLQKIEVYNKCCDSRLAKAIIKGTGLARFFFRKDLEPLSIFPKISLPQKITNQNKENCGDDPSLNLNCSELISIPRQSLELFQMKVISLLERHGVASKREARAYVKMSPIKAALQPDSSKYTLVQTLSLFPGQTIVVKASSDAKSQTICKLFPENFSFSLESTQTGFPYPSQRSGFALSHQLLPENPQRIDLLNASAKILRRRAEAISNLLHQSTILNKAKMRLSDNKKYFQDNLEKLLALHLKLSLTIARASPKGGEDVEDRIFNFFEALKNHPHPFEWLTETHHEMRETFIAKPHEKLIQAILKGKSTTLSDVNPEIRYEAARQILEDAQTSLCDELVKKTKSETAKDQLCRLEYILFFGRLIGKGAHQIMLQYLSEDLVFPPPVLSRFESMVQAAAFAHLNGFLNELEIEKLPIVELESAILEDIAIFNCDNEFPICIELKEYFAARYESLKTQLIS